MNKLVRGIANWAGYTSWHNDFYFKVWWFANHLIPVEASPLRLPLFYKLWANQAWSPTWALVYKPVCHQGPLHTSLLLELFFMISHGQAQHPSTMWSHSGALHNLCASYDEVNKPPHRQGGGNLQCNNHHHLTTWTSSATRWNLNATH